MSHKKKQERLQAGSRKKRGLQVERLEKRVVLSSIAEFGGLATGSAPTSITTGPNGNLWFTESGTDKIGEITTGGNVTEFPLTTGSNPQGITTGPNGNLWFTEYGSNKIGEINTSGTIAEFALATGSNPQQITTGPNGNLWFTEQGTNKIGEIVPSGSTVGMVTEFPLATGSSPFGITSGPNGNIWFTESSASMVGQIVPSGTLAGTISTYNVTAGAYPLGITTGSDGNLYFAENNSGNIGQVTTAGSVTEYLIPPSYSGLAHPKEIVSGPLGDLYFTDSSDNNDIVQMTTQAQFTDFAVPTANASAFGITQGPDNHIWFTEYGANQIGRLNLSPTAVNHTFYVHENQSTLGTNLNVLTNCTDPEGDALSVVNGSNNTVNTAHGVVNLATNGSLVYEPNANFYGVDTYTYSVTDGTDTSNTATIYFDVDIPPVANNDSYITPVSTTLTVNAASGVLANDTDPNTDHTMTAAVVTQPTHGTLTLNSNGSFTYIPTTGYHGSDSFTYHAIDSDGFSTSNAATVSLLVDTPPLANNDNYTTDTNTPLSVSSAANGVLANDTAYNGDTLTVASQNVGTSSTLHGSVTMAADGTFTYTPNTGFYGIDFFSYYAYDGYQNSTSTGLITFTVNAAPTGISHTYEIGQGNVLNVAASNGVLQGDTGTGTLTAVLISGPSHATSGGFTLNADGMFTYTPTSSYSGTDSFTYKVYDGIAYSSLETATLKVDAPPTAVAQTYGTSPNTTLSVNPANGILNGNTDTFSTPLSASIGTNPSHGTVTLNNDGSFTYTPTAGYHGTDSFTYSTYDGFAYSSGTGTVTINVDSPPVVQNQNYNDVQNTSLNELAGQGLLVGATQANSEPLTAVDLTQPSHGTVTVNANGSFSYVPTTGYYGADSFTYTANDGLRNGNTGTVSIYVDQPPVGVADLYNVVENTSLTKNAASGVLANDSDTNDATLTAALVTTTAHGTLNLFQDGSFTYIPNSNYYGNDTFTYQANDGITDSAVTTVTIHVDAPPVGTNDSYNAVENATLNVNAANGVLANDTQAQNESLTSSLISNVTHGTLTLYQDGSFNYVPAANYYGTDSFTYKPYDGIANGNITTVSIFVDSPPVANNDSYTTAFENTPYTVNATNGVLANDTQAQSESLTAVNPTQPSHGTVTLNSDGSFTYTPNSNFYGTDSFTYDAYDGHTNSLTPATVSIRVDGTPVGVADNYEVLQGGTLNQISDFGVLANDSQPQDDALTAVNFTQPSHGTLTPDSGSNAGDGGFTYVPTAGFYGPDTFTYEVNDGYQTSAPVTVTILVDQPPVAVADSYTAVENTPLYVSIGSGVLANDTDAQSQPLTAVDVTQTSNGVLNLNANGRFNYYPNVGFYGTDSFTYKASDGFTTSNTVTVTIHVDAPPVAVADSYNAKEGLPLTVNATNGVLANDTQAQSEPLTASIVTQPANGTVTLNSDGSFSYTPNAQFFGTDTFTYAANDGYTTGNTATVTINVAEDFAPTANNVSQVVGEGGITVNAPGVLTGDTASNGQPLTAVLVSEPAHGSLTFNANGSYVYIPNSSFGSAGTDSFTFRTYDNVLTSSLATVTLTFDGNYYAPVAQPQTYSVAEGSSLTKTAPGLLTGANDYWNLPLTAVILTQPGHGTLTPDGNGDGGFVYTPTANYFGSDSFTYEASNGHTTSSTQTITLNVSQVNGAPVAVNDPYYSLNENGYLNADSSFGVLANDTDPNSLPLTAILVTNPSHGTIAFNADGSFLYTPAASYYGTDSFTYKDTNGSAFSNTATVTFTINQVYSPPTAINQTYTVANGQTLSESTPGVLLGDTDPNGLSLNAQLFGLPSNASNFTLNNDGSFTYTPTAGFVGTDTFTYKAADGQAISSLATVTINITNPITVTGAPFPATAGTAFTGNVGSFTDANPTAPIGNFTATIHWGDNSTSAGTITQPGGVGTAFEVSGTHSYGTTGSLTASVVITDNNSNTSSASTTVNVAAGAPVAVNDSNSIAENATLSVNAQNGVLANDTDPQMHPLTALLVTNPAHGTLVLNGDGSYTYTPNAYYYGTDSFTYKDSDGLGTSNTATVNLTVNQVQYAPVAVADSYTVNENGTLTVPAQTSPLVNDSQPQGDPFYFNPINIHTSQGGLILQDTPGTGAFTYQPAAGFTGTDTFQYQAIDSNNSLASNTVTVTITVTAPNPAAPVAVNDTQIVGETGFTATTSNGGGDVLANDTDNSSNPLSALFVSGPAHGTLDFHSDGTYTYTPNSSFGTAGTDSFTYRAFDGTLTSNVATVTLTFDGTYLPPTAQTQAYSVAENGTLTETAQTGVLNGASDYWNLPLTAINIQNGPAHGSLTLNQNGSFNYTPTAGYQGTDTFQYEANNGHTSSTAQTVTITVTPPTSHAPVAANDSYTTPENASLTTTTQNGVLANDTNNSQNPLSAVLVNTTSHGSLTLNPNGTFTYVPTTGFSGTDTFTYQDSDGTNLSNIATVTLTVTSGETAPVAMPDNYTTTEGGTLTVNAQTGVLANDTDNSVNPLSAILVSTTTQGTLTFNANGSFTYVPDHLFYGTDSFSYQATDGTLTSQTVNVLIAVTHVPTPPVVVNGSYSTSEGNTLNVTAPGVLTNNTNVDHLPLTAELVSTTTHGTLTLNANGSFTYVPNAGYSGSDSFTYKANDTEVDSNVATITLTVAPVDHPPVALADRYTTTEGTTLNESAQTGVLANDTDHSVNPLSAILVSNPTNGTLTLNANGSFKYVPAPGFFGNDTFMYKASDGQMYSNVTTVTLTVNPPVTPPINPPKPTPVAGDYYGTGNADIAVYLVNQGAFAIRNPAGGPDSIVPFGIAGAGQTLPAPGDYFGTGVTDIAAYLPSIGSFAIRNPAGGPDTIVPFGIAGANQTIPAPGDYFGTGQTDIAAYLPSIGSFAIRNPAGGPDTIVPFGIAGAGNSIPIPGDYDGSGKTELAVYMPKLGEFAYRPANGGPDVIVRFGTANNGSIPVPGDYDGSGKTEIAIYDPNYASFAYRPANGGPDVIESFGMTGTGQTLPAPGDYTKVGHDELAAYLPSTATFAIRPGGGQPDILQSFGIAGLGQTIPVTVVDQALAELPPTTVTAQSIVIPDMSATTAPVIFPTNTTTTHKKKHPNQ